MKRAFYILGVLIVSLMLVVGIIAGALMSDKVQNAAVHLCAEELSRGLGADVQIEHISYEFPAKLKIRNVYLSDREQDTLLYMEEMYAHFKPLSLIENRIRFSQLKLKNGYIQIYKTEDGEYNYQFLARAFGGDKKKKEDAIRSIVQVEGIEIDQLRWRIDDIGGEIEHTDVAIHYLQQDSLDAELGSLQAWIKKGGYELRIDDAESRLQISEEGIQIGTLYAKLANSEIDASGVNITKDGEINMDIHRSTITLSDIKLLAPVVGTMDKPFGLVGHIGGTEDSLQVKDLEVSYDGKKVLLIDGCIWHPTTMNPRIAIDCRDLSANAGLIQDLIADWNDRPYLLPAVVHRLGDMHYRGKIEGDANQIELHGGLDTQLGSVQISGEAKASSNYNDIHYKVQVETKKLELGKLLNNYNLGLITVDLTGEGDVKDKKLSGEINGEVSDISYKGYSYDKIAIKGDFTNSSFTGNIKIEDPYLGFSFDGVADWTNQQPKMNFKAKIAHFRPNKLNLTSSLDDLEMGCNIAMTLDGKHADDMRAHIAVDSLRLTGNGEHLNVGQLTIKAEATAQTLEKMISIRSEMLKAEISGRFKYEEIGDILLAQIIEELPNAVDAKTRERLAARKKGNSTIEVSMNAKRLRPLLKILNSNVVVWGDVQVRGKIDETQQGLWVSGYIPRMKIGRKLHLHDINIAIDNQSGPINAQASLSFKGNHYALNNRIEGDSIATELRIIKADSLGGGECGWIGLNTQLGSQQGKLFTTTQIKPSYFTLHDTLFELPQSTIYYQAADTTIRFEEFTIANAQQRLTLDGDMSARQTDSLMVKLQHVEGGPLLSLIVPEEAFKIHGNMTGWVKIFGTLGNPFFESQIHINDFGLGDEYIGDADGMIDFDKEHKSLLIDATAYDQERERAKVVGRINLKRGDWLFDIHPTHFPIQFISFWTSSILDDLRGYASGHVKVFGKDDATYIEAQVKAEDASLVVPYTGCKYYVDDSIFMDSSSIRFPNLRLHDEDGNLVELDGIVRHKCFKNFTFNLQAKPYDARVLDLPDKDGELLQGRVYARGDVNIVGDEHLIQVDATASTSKHSKFRMSISGASSADEHNFVRFVKRQTEQKHAQHYNDWEYEDERSKEEKKVYKPGTRVKLGFNIDATQQLLFQLMLDERTGDKIEARGDGGLRFTYDSQTEDVQLLGTYIVQSGALSFTVGNVIRRDFTVQDGGLIVWNGDPVEPQVNVVANYKVTANLKDLFGSEIDQVATTRTNVPVLTRLYMTGPLFSPVLRFAIDLPMSEDAIRQQVQSVINTDEMLMRQVVYLLVFGKFFTPEYMSVSNQSSGLNDTYSLISSTITGQINQWLSKLTNVFTLGVNIRTEGLGADASQEYEAQFQIQPVDRLLINGNVGYRYNDISNRPFFGDLDVEVLLTENGRLRLKGYTHTVDKYSLRQASTIQGVGFVWKHDFDWGKKNKKTRKKE